MTSLPYKLTNDDKVQREAAMAVGETQDQHFFNARLSLRSAPKGETATPALEAQPLVKEADPELEKLLDEEEAIAQRTAAGETNEGRVSRLRLRKGAAPC